MHRFINLLLNYISSSLHKSFSLLSFTSSSFKDFSIDLNFRKISQKSVFLRSWIYTYYKRKPNTS